MVCLPCIILPVFMFIYLKFIQPYVLRFLPQSWVNFLDPILYPTCPARPPPSAKKTIDENESKEKEEPASCCAGGEESKKEL